MKVADSGPAARIGNELPSLEANDDMRAYGGHEVAESVRKDPPPRQKTTFQRYAGMLGHGVLEVGKFAGPIALGIAAKSAGHIGTEYVIKKASGKLGI